MGPKRKKKEELNLKKIYRKDISYSGIQT